ncbi:MAG: hypothetical protein ACRCWB_00685, partial [Enterovibrio sp.]
KVYAALNQQVGPIPRWPSYAELLKSYVGIDPFKCPSCGNRMIYLSFLPGEGVKAKIALRMYSLRRG